MGESARAQAWRLFDEIVTQAPMTSENPWALSAGSSAEYEPDYDTLRRLLGVPLLLGVSSQSGVPALALDVWTSYELRRAGFAPDQVWPRASVPRVLPQEISTLLAGLPKAMQADVAERIAAGRVRGISLASANVLGKHYVKQVDVVMSSWQTGPELMVSTKRMDSSFGKNAANRVEESYGDAKNLRLRHPQAGLGFLYSLRSTALTQEPDKASWLIDLLAKLGREDDAYDAVALVIPEWDDETADSPVDDDDDENPLVAAGVEAVADEAAEDLPASLSDRMVSAGLARLPEVRLRRAEVPAELDPGRFLGVMIDRVLSGSPVNFHVDARARRTRPRAAPRPYPR